jgi:ATP-dependent DNA ligase
MPCGDRRKRLEREFTDLHDTLQLSPILSGQAHHVLTHVKDFEFEGVIAKRLDSIYAPGKTSDMWQKLKTQKSEDFLVGGYIPGRYGVEQRAQLGYRNRSDTTARCWGEARRPLFLYRLR